MFFFFLLLILMLLCNNKIIKQHRKKQIMTQFTHIILNQHKYTHIKKKLGERKKKQSGEPPLTGNDGYFLERTKPQHDQASMDMVLYLTSRGILNKRNIRIICNLVVTFPPPLSSSACSHYLFLPSLRILAHFLSTLHQLNSHHSFSLSVLPNIEISLLYVFHSPFALQSPLHFSYQLILILWIKYSQVCLLSVRAIDAGNNDSWIETLNASTNKMDLWACSHVLCIALHTFTFL